MSYSETENPINKNFTHEDSTLNDNYLYAASAYDMTGLTPTPAHNEYEAQNYEEIFPYLPPVSPNPADDEVPPVAHGIHNEYRTHVTSQHPHNDGK